MRKIRGFTRYYSDMAKENQEENKIFFAYVNTLFRYAELLIIPMLFKKIKRKIKIFTTAILV